jgi:hypothetical protein
MLNAIEMQGHSDEELEMPENYQDAQANLPLDPVVADNAAQNREPVAANTECLMQISAEALHGIPGDTTLSVMVQINGHQAVALIDSGSTTTFLDSEFVKKTTLPIKHTSAHTVLVAGGGELQSAGYIPNCTFKIQNTEFTYDCKILPLKGYDMVLGANWLKHHGPNYTDWENRSIAIIVQGNWFTIFDRASNHTNSVISAKACSKLVLTGTQAFLIRIATEDTHNTDTGKQQTSNPVSDIIEEFADIFADPTGLPPSRPCDHTIPIKEGSTPPNVRPYRMPHKQKNRVEELVQ